MRLKSSQPAAGKDVLFCFFSLLLLNNNQKKIKLFPSLHCPFITPTSSFPTLLFKEAYKFGFSTSTILSFFLPDGPSPLQYRLCGG